MHINPPALLLTGQWIQSGTLPPRPCFLGWPGCTHDTAVLFGCLACSTMTPTWVHHAAHATLQSCCRASAAHVVLIAVLTAWFSCACSDMGARADDGML